MPPLRLLFSAVAVLSATSSLIWANEADPYPAANPRQLTDVVHKPTPELLARGEYLAEGILHCFACHGENDESLPGAPLLAGTRGKGRVLMDTEERLMVAPNITPDKETGAGNWSDDMLARAIRDGVGHDGRALLFPAMPYRDFAQISDEDLKAVIVYLRSLPPIRHELPRRRLNPADGSKAIKQSSRVVENVPHPNLDDELIRGHYLVELGSCIGCHTGWYKRNPGRLGGGHEFPTKGSEPLFAPNISSAPSGIGNWTAETLATIIRTGKGGILENIMPWQAHKNIKDDDFAAILAYIKSMPPVDHFVVNRIPPTWCEVCEQSHGGGEANQITPLVPFDPDYKAPWDLAGAYLDDQGKVAMTITRDKGQWMMASDDQEPTTLVAMAANKFRTESFDSFISFDVDGENKVTHLRVSGWMNFLLPRQP